MLDSAEITAVSKTRTCSNFSWFVLYQQLASDALEARAKIALGLQPTIDVISSCNSFCESKRSILRLRIAVEVSSELP